MKSYGRGSGVKRNELGVERKWSEEKRIGRGSGVKRNELGVERKWE
jgi:hypothetical protein